MQVPLKYFLISPYTSVLRYQQSLFDKAVSAKERGDAVSPTLIICQHHPVYTLGKNGKKENLLVNPEVFGAELVEINRGGDITFHGPGQMVVYPIWDLDVLKIGVAKYVLNMEEAVMNMLKEYGIQSKRIEGKSGVWVGNEKIAAVGIKVSRHITMHGMALNVNTDLSYFSHIIPCGISDGGVTSMAKILGKNLNMVDVVNAFKKEFENIFNVRIV